MSIKNEIQEWNAVARSYGYELIAAGVSRWRIDFFHGHYVEIARYGDTGDFILTGSYEEVEYLKNAYHYVPTKSGLLLSQGQVKQRISDACKFAADIDPARIRMAAMISEYTSQLESLVKDGRTSVDVVTKQRIGQAVLRKDLLEQRGRCEVSGVMASDLLVVSHIKPWSDCKDVAKECLDDENVLLLAANWDALFDKKFISFDPESGKMVKSERVDEETLRKFGVPDNWRESVSIPIKTERRKEYLYWHNKLMAEEDAKCSMKHDAAD